MKRYQKEGAAICRTTLAGPAVTVRIILVHGLWAKTAIHPTQVGLIQKAYRVSKDEHAMAEKILEQGAPAVFRMNGQMCELTTHRGWAARVLKRVEVYGVQG